MKEPVLVIMAAGMGSRYGGLKQMDKITEAGEIILDFSLYDAYMAGFRKAVIIIKKETEEDFRELIKDRAEKYMDISFAYQDIEDIPCGFIVPQARVKPWGTGHAVLAARNVIDGPFAVINADDYYGPGAFLAIYDFLEKGGSEYAMVSYDVEKTLTENGSVSRGVCAVDDNGYLADITERTKLMWHDEEIAFEEDEKLFPVRKGTPVSMNFWGFSCDFMEKLESGFASALEKIIKENPEKGEYYLPAAVENAMKEQGIKVKVLKSEDRWYGVTYREDRDDVVTALQSMKDKGLYPEKLWK